MISFASLSSVSRYLSRRSLSHARNAVVNRNRNCR